MKEIMRIAWTSNEQVGKTFYIPVESKLELLKMISILDYFDLYQFEIKQTFREYAYYDVEIQRDGKWISWFQLEEYSHMDSLNDFLEEVCETKEYEDFKDKFYDYQDWRDIVNFNRRGRIKDTIRKLNAVKDELESLLSEEEDSFNNMPENLQYSYRGEESQEAISLLEEAIGSIEETTGSLEDIV